MLSLPIGDKGGGMRTTLVIMAVAGGAIPVVTAIAGLVVARSLAPSSYGQVAYFFSLFGLVVLFGSLGLTTQVTTEVARTQGRSEAAPIGERIRLLLLLRVATVAFLALLGALAVFLGDYILAAAIIVGVLALLAGFALGIVQGLGRARLVVMLQLGQALLYLALVAMWAKTASEQVIFALAAAYVAMFAAALPACRQTLASWSVPWSVVRAHWKAVALSSGQLYTVSLLLAPFSAIALLALGRSERFADAATFAIALTLMIFPMTLSATAISVQFYPQLCLLLERREGSANLEWFDSFYKPFAVLSISVAVLLALAPQELIVLLYTSKYVASIELLASMAAGAGFLTLGQLLIWTLVAHRRMRWAIGGALTQLALLLVAVFFTAALPELPLRWLGIGHSLAAAAALAIWGVGVKRTDAAYSLNCWRIAFAGIAALLVGILFQQAFQRVVVNWQAPATLVACALGPGIASGSIIFYKDILRLRPSAVLNR